MKLSIVVPIYRVEATLDRCLKSIVDQTYTDLEVILVDDGSPDNCPQLCDKWAEKDGRIKVIHKQNGGLSDARNAGIDVAEGEFITFVDSDDYLELETYEKVMKRVTDTDADIVEFPVNRQYGSKEQQRLSFPEKAYTDMDDYWLHCRAYDHSYAWNKVYRRRLFGDDVRFPAGRVFEDIATLPSLLNKAEKVVTTGEGLYYYCANGNGITATASGEQLNMLLESHLAVIGEHPEYINDDVYYMLLLNIQIDVCRMTGRKAMLPHRFVNPLAHGLTMKQRLKAALQDCMGARGLALTAMADTRFVLMVAVLCSLPAVTMFAVNEGMDIIRPRTLAALAMVPMVPALLAWVLSIVMGRWPKTATPIKAVVYALCIALMGVNMMLVLNFGTMVTPAMLMLLGETNGSETANFMSTYGLTGGTMAACLLTLAAIVTVVKMKTQVKKMGRTAMLLMLVAAAGGAFQLWKMGQMMGCKTQSDMEMWFWNKGTYCVNNTLTGLVYSYHMLNIVAADNVRAMKTNHEALRQPAATACDRDTLHVVLVIGESYSKRHAGIYGYTLNTTPRQQEAMDSGRLTVFTDAVSPYNMTTMAVRNMLSTNSISTGESWADKPLMTVVFKQAGYHVMMWDNQMGQNGNVSIQDFTLSSLLHNNEMRQMAYTQYNTTTNDLDMPFADSCLHATNLQQHCHTLAIYHLAGQHFAARNHYPSDGSYDVFSYKDIRRNDLSETQRQEIAEYDNATRYNDAVIGHIMDYYRHTPAVMIYLSDHGEEVYDYRHFIGRSHEKNKSPEAIRCQYEIPMTIWCSNSFKQQYPELVKAIATAASKPFMADNLPHMLLDMAAIETPYYNEKKDMLSRSYRCGTRLIQNTTDYDQAIKR